MYPKKVVYKCYPMRGGGFSRHLTMADNEHYVYLTNLRNRDVYPDNTPGQFETRLNPSLKLDPNRDYEVALINCFYPKTFYSLPKQDFSACIEVWAIAHACIRIFFTSFYLRLTLKPEMCDT